MSEITVTGILGKHCNRTGFSKFIVAVGPVYKQVNLEALKL